MTTWSLTEIEHAIRDSWSAETGYLNEAGPAWHQDNPARGQCGTTALVVQDLLGGDLLIADVTAPGEPDSVHYWNRLGLLDIDVTREQFGPEHKIGEPRVVVRPPDGPRQGAQQYELLRQRVLGRLDRRG